MGTTRQDIQSSMCATALLTWVSNLNTGLKKPSQAYYSTLGLSLISMLCFHFLSFAHIWRFWRCRSCKWSWRSSGLSAISRRSTGGCMMPAWSKRMNRFNTPVYKAHAGAGQWCEDSMSVLYQLQARARCRSPGVSIDLMPLDPIKIQLTAANIITGRQAIDVNRSTTVDSMCWNRSTGAGPTLNCQPPRGELTAGPTAHVSLPPAVAQQVPLLPVLPRSIKLCCPCSIGCIHQHVEADMELLLLHAIPPPFHHHLVQHSCNS